MHGDVNVKKENCSPLPQHTLSSGSDVLHV